MDAALNQYFISCGALDGRGVILLSGQKTVEGNDAHRALQHPFLQTVRFGPATGRRVNQGRIQGFRGRPLQISLHFQKTCFPDIRKLSKGPDSDAAAQDVKSHADDQEPDQAVYGFSDFPAALFSHAFIPPYCFQYMSHRTRLCQDRARFRASEIVKLKRRIISSTFFGVTNMPFNPGGTLLRSPVAS